MRIARKARLLSVVIGILGLLLASRNVLAHCDTMDGPVIVDAKQALEKGDITPVLKWVKAGAEQEIRPVFEKVLAIRNNGPKEKEVADAYFFETLVRVHRAGEGAPYEGIKPAGTALEPGIKEADEALVTGSAEALIEDLTDDIAHGVQERFAPARDAATHKDESVEAGREYVEAYVIFMHYVEGLYKGVSADGHGCAAPHAEKAEAKVHEEQSGEARTHEHQH